MRAGSLKKQFFHDGQVEDCPIYDMHGHMGPLPGGQLPIHTPTRVVAAMERAGVKLAVFCHHSTLFTPEVGNGVHVEIVRQFPQHFRAYCGINPNYPEQARQDLDAFAQFRDVYVGFKFLADYHRIAITDPAYAPAWEYADRHGLLVLLHTWGGSSFDGPDAVRACAAKYPGASILMGHSCHGAWDKAIALVKDFPNVYAELTAVLDDRGVLERLVREMGSERILFGTDTTWFNHHYYIGAVLGADIDDEARRNIFYRNAEKLLAPLMTAAPGS
jgi:uncharacterized protein